jgi:redox-sensing transcriptional repressor
MRQFGKIPEETVRRILAYLRQIEWLAKQGKKQFSSQDLADLLDTNPAQIRKDLSYFGEFGTRGVGYKTERLVEELRKILNMNKHWKVVLVGVGNIGSALLKNPDLKDEGFEIVMAFDRDPEVIGKKVGGIVVEDVAGLQKRVREAGIRLAIIAVDAESTQEVADFLVDGGVEGILCFGPLPCELTVPKSVNLLPIDIPLELGRLVYEL